MQRRQPTSLSKPAFPSLHCQVTVWPLSKYETHAIRTFRFPAPHHCDDASIGSIARAQKSDGYLYVPHLTGAINVREMGPRPYSCVIHSHELCNMGHRYEAAVAYARATGKTKLLAVADSRLGTGAYSRALDRIWHNLVDTKMHLTGGLGAVHGIEGFGPSYQLPNQDTYLETCAAVGNVFFNLRMFLKYADAKFVDVAEIALLNNCLSGIGLDGTSFFYPNPLEADDGHRPRAGWFGTACCPANIAQPDLLNPAHLKFASVRASHTFEQDTVAAVRLRHHPKSSADRSIRRWTSWPQRGQEQWLEIQLGEPRRIRSVGVYWYNDNGGVQLPGTWHLEVPQDGQWQPVALDNTDDYSVLPDTYNTVHPAPPLRTDTLRLVLKPRARDTCIGILSVNVEME